MAECFSECRYLCGGVIVVNMHSLSSSHTLAQEVRLMLARHLCMTALPPARVAQTASRHQSPSL